jgi:hypothetical protein
MARTNEREHGAREVFVLRGDLAPGQPFVHRAPDGQSVSFQVLSEVEVAGRHYAIMRGLDDHPDDALLFRIEGGTAREIDDDNEWETIAEAVDEMLYFHDS